MQQLSQLNPEEVKIKDQLEMQAIFYWIFGAIGLFASFFLFIYGIIFGAFLFLAPIEELSESYVEINTINWIAIGYISFFVYVFSAAILQVILGFKLMKKRHKGFCIFVAIYSLLAIPVGTVLGIFTISVLSKPEAKEMYIREEEKREEIYERKRF